MGESHLYHVRDTVTPRASVAGSRKFCRDSEFFLTATADALLALRGLRHVLVEADADCWIAGGAVRDLLRGDTPRDFDVFFRDNVGRDKAERNLVASGWARAKLTDRSQVLVRRDQRVDLVRMQFRNMLECIAQFDFVACAAAISLERFAYHERFMQDAEAGVLRLNACPDPPSTIRRVARLVSRGWAMPVEEMAAVAHAAGERKPTDLREYLEELQSADGSGWNPWGDDKGTEDLSGDLDEVA